MAITLRVADRLKALGWTAYRLSKEAHLPFSTAYRVSKPGGARYARIDVRTLERLCAALNCQPGDILHWDGKRPWH
jgi:DNA-binding Xre family transcriptional regulator